MLGAIVGGQSLRRRQNGWLLSQCCRVLTHCGTILRQYRPIFTLLWAILGHFDLTGPILGLF